MVPTQLLLMGVSLKQQDLFRSSTRMLHNGSASAFQADGAGSIPAIRSLGKLMFKRKGIL